MVSGQPSAPSQAPALPPGPSSVPSTHPRDSLRSAARSWLVRLLCGLMAEWGGTTRRFRGRSWRRGCRGGSVLTIRWIPTGPAQPVAAGSSPSRRPALAPEPDPAAQLDRNGDPIPPWSRSRRERGAPPTPPRRRPFPYAELHSHSNFSFLDGASDPEDLIEEAVRLGLTALAITDHDGLYAVARFAEAAQGYDLATIYGAELSLGLRTPQNGVADPEGSHLLVLARGVEGYHRLAAAITEAQLRGDEKGRPLYDLDELAAAGRRALDDPDRLPQGSRTPGARRRRTGRRGAGAGPADRAVRPRPGGGRADRPRPSRRLDDQRPAGRAGPGARPAGGGHQRRALRPAAAVPAGQRHGRGPGPPQPAGDGRLAAGARGAPAVGGGDGPDLRPLPGGDRADRGRGRGVCLQPEAGQAAAAQARGAARGHPDQLAAGADPARGGGALSRTGARSRTSGCSGSWR